MLHLLPLPGAPGFSGTVGKVREAMLRDADVLVRGGVHGLMVENFGDVPFFKSGLPPVVVAHMTAMAAEVKRRFDVPLGINCLRNDGLAALSIAHAVGAEYIRVNILTGARVTDQGIIEGGGAEIMRLRRALGAESIQVLADVDVKHSAPLGAMKLEDEVDDTLERGLADGLVISGAGTGKATDLDKVRRVRAAAPRAKLYIGSGVTRDSIADFMPLVDGVIVGTHFKAGGRVDRPVDLKRVKALMARVK